MSEADASMALRSTDLSRVRQVVLIGKDPVAMVMASSLHRSGIHDVVLVGDDSPWLEEWKEREERRATEYLRAPDVHHAHENRLALRNFSKKKKRDGERIVSAAKMEALPGLQLFADFNKERLVNEFDGSLQRCVEERVVNIEQLTESESKILSVPRGTCCKVSFASGNALYSKAVVYCKSPSIKSMPEWASRMENAERRDALLHSEDLDVRDFDCKSKRIAIVGGGMTASQLAWHACKHGAEVVLIARHRIKKQEMDCDLGWQGMKLLRSSRWDSKSPLQRLHICKEARPQATINKLMWEALQDCIRKGSLRILQDCEVHSISWIDAQWSIALKSTKHSNGWGRKMFDEDESQTIPSSIEADAIWLATGSAFDLNADPFLTELLQKYPTRIVEGFPVLDDSLLAWPKLPLYFIGPLTMLSTGPAASIYPGWREAAQRITSHLVNECFPSSGSVEESRLAEEEDVIPQVPTSLLEENELGTRTKCDLEKYSWTDEDFLVTIRIYVNEPLEKNNVRVRFKKQGLELWALTEKNAYRLSIPLLYKPIIEDRCKLKVNEARGRISVVLHKYDNHEWRFLKG